MTRGIVYVAYDGRPHKDRKDILSADFTAELSQSAAMARRTGLPICLLIEAGARLAIDLPAFDEWLVFDTPFAGPGNSMRRKLHVWTHSPWDETLYLDSDTVILADNVDEIFGAPLSMTIDHYRPGWGYAWDIVCHRYTGHWLLPLYNAGVFAFQKAQTRLLASRAMEIAIAEPDCDDQVCLNAAIHETGFPVRVLGPEWNCRESLDGETKIAHYPGAFKEVRERQKRTRG